MDDQPDRYGPGARTVRQSRRTVIEEHTMTDRRFMYAEAVDIIANGHAVTDTPTPAYNERPGHPGHFVSTVSDTDDRVICNHPTHRHIADQFNCGFSAIWAGATTHEPDPFAGKPFGEQQGQVDWLESRYDDDDRTESAFYGTWDD